MKKLFLLLIINLCAFSQHNIIPRPVSYIDKTGGFLLSKSLNVFVNESEPKQMVQNFAGFKDNKLNFKPFSEAKGRGIFVNLNTSENTALGAEGYELEVSALKIAIVANKPAGIFNGLQTLRQILPEKTTLGIVKACKITDYPKYAWRGLMLDVSRHFFTKAEVKDYLDLMAQYKFNTFHWHLADDNGWRIEIKSLPKLTTVGAWRVARYGSFGERKDPQPGEATPYGGFYTQDDIREVVTYAAERNITIVPEIDIPGHSMAMLAAYPELSTKKEPKFVNPGTKFAEWFGNGQFKMLVENTLNPVDENVYATLDKVFAEVAALFPGQYIHMGGDEAYHGFWEEDPACKAFMVKEGLKNTHELQSYFVKRVEKIINSKGKSMMGWDEILEGGLAPNAAVMSWRGMAGGIEAAKQKHPVVMSPTTYAYLDYTQGDPSVEKGIYADLSLSKTFEFNPLPDGVDAQYILGGQANLWTEQVQNYRHATYMTYPRAWAIAENTWADPKEKNWDNFLKRVEGHFGRMEKQGIKVAKTVYEPTVRLKLEGEKLSAKITTEFPDLQVRYTIDDSQPDAFSPLASSNVFEIPAGNIKLRLQSFKGDAPIGRLLIIDREDLVKRAAQKRFQY